MNRSATVCSIFTFGPFFHRPIWALQPYCPAFPLRKNESAQLQSLNVISLPAKNEIPYQSPCPGPQPPGPVEFATFGADQYPTNPLSKEDAIRHFDPDGAAAPGRLFGLPFSPEQAELIIIPVPWEVTVSYAAGCAKGPEAVLQASTQVDLFQHDIVQAWQYGIALLPFPEHIARLSDSLRRESEAYIRKLEAGEVDEDSPEATQFTARIDEGCSQMNDWVQGQAAAWRSRGKKVALLGGDHSTPLGLLRDLASVHESFGILQFDAHADLRQAYEGFTYSHASIMYNVLKLPQVSKLVQVGIRDFCESEARLIQDSQGRIKTYFYPDLAARSYRGEHWSSICEEIIARLPQKVYVSFDIDGLDPKLCPNTGTPVPGGFEYEEVNYLLTSLSASGREIIAFDLTEVSPGSEPEALQHNDWDGNVGARLLYRMCNLMGVSQGALKLAH